MIRTIPKQEIFICDVCLVESKKKIYSAALILNRDKLDPIYNLPCSREFTYKDLCDDCFLEISLVLNLKTIEILERKKQNSSVNHLVK